MYNLGINYETGVGCNQNMQIAIGLYQSAAKLGHIDAQSKIEYLNKL